MATATLLVVTALVAVVHVRMTGVLLAPVTVAVVGLGLLTAGPRPAGRSPVSVDVLARPTLELLLHLSPVALLTLIFPIASSRLGGVQVGGTALTTLLLGSSLTVPWLGQAVCMPIYRALGVVIHGGDPDQVNQRFCQVWPAAVVQSLPAVAVFVVPVELVMRWSPTAFGTYLTLIVLHLIFAQSLVLANVGRNRWRWAAAWACYAAVLLLLPRAWYLPPLVGTTTQLVPLGRHLRRLRQPAVLDGFEVARDLRRGLLLGAVLWADKLLLFVKYGNQFPVTTVFLALLPAILAYNYYFVRLAPRFDSAVLQLRAAMEHDRFSGLSEHSEALSLTVRGAITRTAFVGSLLGLVVTAAVQEIQPHSAGLVGAVTIASWLFMMTTVVSYKLDYIGKLRQAQLVGAAHLAGCLVAFAALPLGVPLYAALIGLEAVLFAVALHSCLRHWRSSEYTLFWRHATAW